MNRQEVKEKYKWKIEDIYSSDKEWEKDFALAEKSLDFSEFAGKLSNAETLLKFLRKDEEFSKLADRLGVYAHMRKDEDAANAKYAAY
ncbi:MAG: oligoendopeptidase F, partial [Clostridia bacterium]|nr:oligoendopeptidase F [Clostridia bacterium]